MSFQAIADAFAEADTTTFLWRLAGGLLVLACWSVYAEHRRGQRPDLDRPGWMPWNLIQILAFLAAIAAAALALKS